MAAAVLTAAGVPRTLSAEPVCALRCSAVAGQALTPSPTGRVADPPPATARPEPPGTPVPTATAAPHRSPPAGASPPPRPAPPSPGVPGVPVNVGPALAVGDSVTIDIGPALRRDVTGVTVDGRVGRQFSAGVQIVDVLRAAGRLPGVVVVALGTNGTVSPPDFEAMMRAASGARRVVFVTVHVPRSWETEVNEALRDGVARHPGVATLVDWHGQSQGHPEWFAPDGYHVTPAGSEVLARLIAGALSA